MIPNSYQTPNVLVDQLMQWVTPNEWVVLSFMVRHILGWQDKITERRNRISLSQFENGMNDQMGGCGLSRPQISAALKELVKYRVIEKIGEPTRDGQEWELIDHPDFDMAGLQERREAKKKQGQKRVKKAAQVSALARRGTLDVPLPGTADVPAEGYAGRTSRGTSDVPTNGTLGVHTKSNKPNVVVESESDPDLPVQQQQQPPTPPPQRDPSAIEAQLFDELHIGEAIWQIWMRHEPVTVIAAFLHVTKEEGVGSALALMRSMLEHGKGAPKRKYFEGARKAIERGSLEVIDPGDQQTLNDPDGDQVWMDARGLSPEDRAHFQRLQALVGSVNAREQFEREASSVS